MKAIKFMWKSLVHLPDLRSVSWSREKKKEKKCEFPSGNDSRWNQLLENHDKWSNESFPGNTHTILSFPFLQEKCFLGALSRSFIFWGIRTRISSLLSIPIFASASQVSFFLSHITSNSSVSKMLRPEHCQKS